MWFCFHGEKVDKKSGRHIYDGFFYYYSSQDIKFMVKSSFRNYLYQDLNANEVEEDAHQALVFQFKKYLIKGI